MNDHLDLPDEGCWAVLTPEIGLGDVCRPVPLPKLAPGVELAVDAGPPRCYWVEVEMGFAIVTAIFDVYAVVAPIAIAELAEDRDQFDLLIESGRRAKEYIRLPGLPVVSTDDAVALLYCPHTRLVAELEPLRVASMSSLGHERFVRRVARAFEV